MGRRRGRGIEDRGERERGDGSRTVRRGGIMGRRRGSGIEDRGGRGRANGSGTSGGSLIFRGCEPLGILIVRRLRASGRASLDCFTNHVRSCREL